jgi:D-tyrosyl-tRNA(Tyr) deacylase
VTVEAEGYRAAIGRGLAILLAVVRGDGEAEATWMAGKLARLRIFPDDEGRMNRSVQDIGGEVLLVSQFTLAGDCRKGNRPSFVDAADPDEGRGLYERVGRLLETDQGVPVKTGRFGAMMQVELVNDGPVTLIVERGAHRSA